jgi:hypothetical protein
MLTVRSPSGEVFQVPVELADENPLMPKTGVGSFTAIGDVQSYSNLEAEQIKDKARAEILAAAQKLKDPNNPAHNKGYCNLLALEYGVGGSNPAVSKKQREAGIL